MRGFELAHAACPWTPPTADQPGLIGPNWAKGWIIEDNVIHDAKCSAVSLGKEASTGHNYATLRRDKPGYQYQLESVFAARQIGWDREHVGSHIVRRNVIYDCGQNGIVGHLGCVFSTIEDNHIYNIALKREFYGYEIAGIKLHAAIDVVIRHNRIHDCSLGIWLDWQTQGTRVSRNLFYGNNRDLFIEVSHGPHLVEHNVLASPVSLELFSQGGAFVNNLVCGTVLLQPVVERPTPYHVPHSTQVAGYAAIHGGDDRHIGNVFLGGDAGSAYGPTRALWRAAPATAPPGTTGIPRRWPSTSPRSTTPPAATTNDSWASSNPSGSATTSTPRAPARTRPSTIRSSSTTRREGRRRRRGRRGLPRDCSCRRRSTRRASGSSPAGTSSASGSWTRSSRNATAARPASTPTSSAAARPTGRPTPPDRSPRSRRAPHASACGDGRRRRPGADEHGRAVCR